MDVTRLSVNMIRNMGTLCLDDDVLMLDKIHTLLNRGGNRALRNRRDSGETDATGVQKPAQRGEDQLASLLRPWFQRPVGIRESLPNARG